MRPTRNELCSFNTAARKEGCRWPQIKRPASTMTLWGRKQLGCDSQAGLARAKTRIGTTRSSSTRSSWAIDRPRKVEHEEILREGLPDVGKVYRRGDAQMVVIR